MSRRTTVLAAGVSSLIFGCADLQRDRADDTQEIIDNLVEAGYPAREIKVVDGVVYVGGDAQVTLEASREMTQTGDSSQEQYRSTNLVSPNTKTICVDGSTLTDTTVFDKALTEAIANFNTLGLRFRLTRTTGATDTCDATITARTGSGTTGGTAGFPTEGRPFDTITIGSDLTRTNTTTVERVITHELGHTIGLRHSDFFDRSISCGGQTGTEVDTEGEGTTGAILIPGTPEGATPGGSVMNSCFRTGETPEFTASDTAAIKTLYGR